MSFIDKQITRAGVPVRPISFTIGDVEAPPETLTVAASSDNPGVISDSNIVLAKTDATGTNWTVKLFPSTTVAGTANITIAVKDSGNPSLTTLQTFVLTVQEPATPFFGNRSSIFISDSGSATQPTSTAALYPSPINVTGLVGQVADITVTLLDIDHPTPEDIGVMLVGPGTNPGKVILMRDSGAGSPLTNAVLIFQDNTPNSVPLNGPITNGFYRPTDRGSGAFPTAGSSTTTSFGTAFTGINPNGTWNLYVIDDTQNLTHGADILGGWQLAIHTTPKITPIPEQITPEDVALRVGVTIGDNQALPSISLSATCGNPNLVSDTNFTFSGTGATRTLKITPNTNQYG